MKRSVQLSVLFLLGCVSSATLSAFMTAELILGDLTFPKLRAWNFEDLSGTPNLFVSKTVAGEDVNAVALYELVPPGESGPASPLGSAIRLEGSGDAVGAFFYAENDGNGTAFGINPHAATYSGKPAVGMEVNGINLSGRANALVRGIDIVNGGNAPTQWALGVQTSVASPAGKPGYGLILAGTSYGYPHNPASKVGLVIDRVDSGRAIEIAADHDIVLDGRDGQIRMRYNSESEQIEFYRDGELRFSIPM
jgi:hypothetical protein